MEILNELSVYANPEFFRLCIFTLLFVAVWWLKACLNELRSINKMLKHEIQVLPHNKKGTNNFDGVK